jgi:hypothetical protein
MAKKDITNQRFGRLVAIRDTGRSKYKSGSRLWLCRCDCGNSINSELCHLTSGDTKSCGCLKGEILRTRTESERLNDGESAFNALYRDYRRSAARKGRQFELTKEQFRYLTSGECFYCGEVPRREYWANAQRLSGPYVYNGIDRLNNDLGYVVDNCVPCCWRCNQLKGSMPFEIFRGLVKIIHERIGDKTV